MRKNRKVVGGLVFTIIVFCVCSLQAQVNHSYPRIVVQHFGKAPSDWYARFDMAVVDWDDTTKVKEIKAINSETWVFRTYGWTSYEEDSIALYIDSSVPQWFAVDASGNRISLNHGQLLDMSNLCPSVGAFGQYFDSHPDTLVANIDLNHYDGIGSDWCWEKPVNISDIDLDRDGINDYTQHGTAWVDSTWLVGVLKFVANVRTKMGSTKLLWVNAGKFQDWGWADANGLEIERKFGFFSWNSIWTNYQNFMATARTPHALIMDVRPDAADPNLPAKSRNYYRLARFMLGATLLGDGYIEFNPIEAGEHHFFAYYDEYDVALGFPKGDAQKIGTDDVYARFFDNGAVIVNITGAQVQVAVADISGLTGYAGPYYRFSGGQDGAFNDGTLFDTVTLWGGSHNNAKQGDGILLVTSALDTVVADIIVDNNDLDTSAGSEPAVLSAGWTLSGTGSNYWAQDVQTSKGWYAHAFTGSGTGNETAVFTPTIGVTGNYQIFEWHGQIEGAQMATDAPYKIVYDDGTKEVIKRIDQSANQGKLNSLGTFRFVKGAPVNVTISDDASGTVAADMIMFQYVSASALPPPIVTNNYYISNNGNDSNDGRSSALPWKTVAKVNATVLSAGQRVLFEYGGVWREQLTTSASGVIYGAYGCQSDGKPILTSADVISGFTVETGNKWSVSLTTDTDVVVIDDSLGEEQSSSGNLAKNYDWYYDGVGDKLWIYLTTNPASSIIEYGKRNQVFHVLHGSVTVENLDFRGADDEASIFGSGLLVGADNVTVKNCTFKHNAYAGFTSSDASDNGVVENCIAEYNVNHGLTFGLGSGWEVNGGIQRWNQRGNGIVTSGTSSWVHDILNHDNGRIRTLSGLPVNFGFVHGVYFVDDGNNGLVENCIIYESDGGNGINFQQNGTIRYNKIYSGEGAGILLEQIPSAGVVKIHYNVMWDNNVALWLNNSSWNTGTNVEFFNNVCYENNRQSAQHSTEPTELNVLVDVVGDLELKNNIFFKTNGNFHLLTFTVDQGTNQVNLVNDFNDVLNTGTSVIANTPAGTKTFSAWKTWSGGGNSSINVDPSVRNANNNDYHLKAGSPCIDVGTNVSLTKDFDGITVPQGAAQDMGAFEFR